LFVKEYNQEMASPHIGHSEISIYADDRINLPTVFAKKYRDQVAELRKRLESKISEDPAFDLVKMLHAGSVAKGTALRTINDLDVAVYVRKGDAPLSDGELMPWLRDLLEAANPNMDTSQFSAEDHCVTVSFKGSGLDVDVVPVLYEDDPKDFGYLVRKHSGQRVLTSIPLHLEFIRKRKAEYGDNFAQLIRLIKWWKLQRCEIDKDFRFKSFMIELIWAHLADSGISLDDYSIALEAFFNFVVTTELKSRIIFTDYYAASEIPKKSQGAIEIFDPVNPDNNVGRNYEEVDRLRIVSAAHEALDSLSEARFAITKQEALECWQDILGKGFKG
jgi:tRNA nucleotidyltransferase (CCA-adding enzyme)